MHSAPHPDGCTLLLALLRLQVSKSVWGSVQALKELEDYTTLPDDLVGSSKRWREWMELERPGGLTKAAAQARRCTFPVG